MHQLKERPKIVCFCQLQCLGYLVSELVSHAVSSSNVLPCIAFGSKDTNDVSDPVLIAELFGVEDISGKIDDSWTRVDNTGQSDATSKSPGCTEQCSESPVVSGTLAGWTEIADCSTVVLSSVDG